MLSWYETSPQPKSSETIMTSFGFSNGKIKLEGIYKEGKRHGRQSYFFPNGEIYSSGIYQNDMKIGEWIYNNEEGITDTIINYNE